jgi:hypothetical protein
MEWVGWKIRHESGRTGEICRSHGNWLAIVRFKNGNPIAGEYFSYGEPGALDRARRWVEERLKEGKRRRS